MKVWKHKEYENFIRENAEEIANYENFIKENAVEIANAVDAAFHEQEETIKEKLLSIIAEYVNDNPAHYIWQDDGCPYDDSGELVTDGVIDLNQSVYEFLSEEYTGAWELTFESHHGKRYCTFGDELSNSTLEIAEGIIQETTIGILKKHFGKSFDEELFQEAMIDGGQELILDNAEMPWKYFVWEYPVQAAGINEIPLKLL